MTHKITISFDDDVWIKVQNKKNISKFLNELLRNEFDFDEKEEEIISRELEHFKKTGEYYQLDEVILKK